MKRRNFVKLGLLGSCSTLLTAKPTPNQITLFDAFSKPVAIPPILEPILSKEGIKEYTLNVQEGQSQFLKGAKTNTYGINTDFLGPTIRVQKGDTVRIKVNNHLKEETVLHWHGLKVPGINDGGPNRAIEPTKSWTTKFPINQRSSLCWYHPHTHKKTDIQVYMGLAGLFIIDDEESLKAKIPKEYGIDDIPLIFQDRRLDGNAQFVHKQSMHDVMMGVTGNIFMVNGVINPYIELSPKTVRLRILNGANARFYSFVFEDDRNFYQIAGDSSFLPNPVKMKQLILSPGERAEILVDLSDLKGKTIMLGDSFANKALLLIKVKDEKSQRFQIPNKLTTIHEYQDLRGAKRREFSLDVRPGWVGINGKQMDMNRIDEKVTLGQTEVWRIKNPQNMPHPFHIHGCSFKILSRNSMPSYANEKGLKDTVLLYGGETVEVAVKFDHIANKNYPYMYHCHILEHEDAGMMGQFTVEPDYI